MAASVLSDLALSIVESVARTAPDTDLRAVVVAYYPDDQTADVRLAVHIPQLDPETGALVGLVAPTLYRRPVDWPAGGGRSLVWGLSAGDVVAVRVRSRSHDEVDSGTALPVTPASTRRGNPSDVVVIPAAGRPGAPLDTAAYRDDGQPVLAMPADEALHVGASTAALRLVIEDVLRPYLVELDAWLSSHQHAGVTIGSALSGAPPPLVPTPTIPASGALASGRIKVDT